MLPPPSITPDTLKGIDDLIRAGLIGFRENCFNWLLAATGLVIAGLVLEGPELWYEILSIVRHWGFRRKFKFSLPEEHTPNWVKLIAFVGWIVIVIGVAGEYVADSFVSRADGFVQTFDEILLTETQNRTALASERASAAYERASENEKETAATLKQAEQERADAARSLEVTRGYESQIAQANERAAHAEQRAEEEQTARTKLEQKLAWRSLTNEQAERIARKLRSFPGQQFDFVTYSNEGECLNFQDVLYRLFLYSRWTLDPKRQWGMLITLIVGLEVQVSEGADEQVRQAASTLVKALNDENILATLKTIPAKDAPATAVIKIAVGKSPSSMEPIE